MDILQIALVFLIILLSVFLSILGLQVFLILRDLRRDLNKLDKLVRTEIKDAHELDSQVVDTIVKSETKGTQKTTLQKPRFYKKILK